MLRLARKISHFRIWLEPSGLNWRKIAISLIDPDFGEQTAQACANAWFQLLLSAPTTGQ